MKRGAHETKPANGKSRLENRVRSLRKARGLRQQDLAALLGVSRQTVIAIEAGRYDPGLPLALDIGRVFAARVEDIFRIKPAEAGTAEWKPPMITIPSGLTGTRVRLRRHRASDLPAFQRFIADPEAVRYMAFTEEQKTSDGAAALMDAVIESYAGDEPVLSLTITEAGQDDYAGAVGGAPSSDSAWEVYATIMPERQRQGLATDAMHLLIRFLFESCGAKELRADTVAGNEASIALFLKLGFRMAGAVNRAAETGAFAHREMTGLRFVLTAAVYWKEQKQDEHA